eukprot:GHVN01044312.1.p1 GENE.GHVN01044312.1~~GHVN01044312.1.p1  ORF type:complete len:156 (+),score=47.20 GHVN01044312.1:321-788(+)
MRGSDENLNEVVAIVSEVMSEVLGEDYPIHCHCFLQPKWVLDLFADKFSNMMFGVTAGLPKQKNLHASLRALPLTRMLLETDSPWFKPSAFRGKKFPCHPGMVGLVAKDIVEVKNNKRSTVDKQGEVSEVSEVSEVTVEDVVKATRENTRVLYGV